MDPTNQRLETGYEPIHVDVWRPDLRLSDGTIYTKFFTDSILELVARVKALFRRQEAMIRNMKIDAGTLSFTGLTIDPLAREVWLDQKAVELTPREFDLLYFFARHPGKVFSRLSLLNQVWGYQHEGYEHTVNTHINRLRLKIERNPAEPERLLTVWGLGYKFAAVAENA